MALDDEDHLAPESHIAKAEAHLYRQLQVALEIEAEVTGSHLAQLVARNAREGAVVALRALLDADPHDPKTIMQLQNEAKRYRDMTLWIAAALANGDQAAQSISESQG